MARSQAAMTTDIHWVSPWLLHVMCQEIGEGGGAGRNGLGFPVFLLRSNSDQRQISLCNTNAFLVREVMRIKDHSK